MRITILVVALLIGSTTRAWAYIDPGSGSFLFQVLIAGILSVGVAVKMFWRNIKSTLFRKRSDDADDSTNVG